MHDARNNASDDTHTHISDTSVAVSIMKVIIVGAGDVGFVSAETISEDHDVLVIEKDEDVAESLKSRLNVAVLREDGTNPRVLRYAIESHGADVILASLPADSESLFVCMMAKRIKPGIKTVAAVNGPDFVAEANVSGMDGVDHIVSPDLVTARKMYKLCVLENVIEYDAIDEMNACIAVFKVEPDHQIRGRVVMQLPMPRDCTVFAIYRDGEMHTSPETMEIHGGDILCVFGSDQAVEEFNDLVGVDHVSREFCVLGGSVVGINLAKMLSEDPKKRYIKIIDKDPERCRTLSKELSGVAVINSDYTDPDVQFEENLFKSDAVVSTSSRDGTNLLVCMSAKRHNSRKVIARYFMREYEDIFRYADLLTIIGCDRIISNEVVKSILPEEATIARMQFTDGLFFMHAIDGSSKLEGRFVGDLNMPEGLRIVAIRRGDSIIYPLLDTKLLTGDSAVVFSNGKRESEIIKVLGKRPLPEM